LIQNYGSEDPDPKEIVTDLEHCLKHNELNTCTGRYLPSELQYVEKAIEDGKYGIKVGKTEKDQHATIYEKLL
jgi:hypothetical protein